MASNPFTSLLSPRPLMKNLMMAGTIAVSAVALTSCASKSGADESPAGAESGAGPHESEPSLLSSLNAARRQAGKSELAVSAKLTQLARVESQSAAAGTGFQSGGTERIRRLSGLPTVGTLHGVLKDRGPQTGSSFVDYWKKDALETLVRDWSQVGIGISKSADGRLFAILIFGSNQVLGGGSLMTPALSPGRR